MNLLAGEVWIIVDGQRYTLHFKDFATATEFCRAFNAYTENGQ
jgi:hypothetical protein